MTDRPLDPTSFVIEARFDELSRDESLRLAELTNDPSMEARSERLAILRKVPSVAARVGDLARQLEQNLARDFDPGLAGDTITVRCEQMRQDLGYGNSGEVERLIIDRIILTWLHLMRLEADRRRAWAKQAFLPERDWYDKQVSRANADHLRALTALARVRRLQIVIGQVNISTGAQTNVATVGRPDQGGDDVAGDSDARRT